MRHDLYRQQIERDKYLIKDCCTLCGGQDTSCSCHFAFKKRNAFLKSGIPTKYLDLSLSELKQPGIKKAKEGVQAYIANMPQNIAEGKGLYIWSQVIAKRVRPIGKSTLGHMVLMEAANRGVHVYVTNMQDIADARTADKDQTDDTHFSRENIEMCDILLIDDIADSYAMHQAHPYLKSGIVKVCSDRSNMKKPTIITSSLSPKELDDVFGEHFRQCLDRNTAFLEVF